MLYTPLAVAGVSGIWSLCSLVPQRIGRRTVAPAGLVVALCVSLAIVVTNGAGWTSAASAVAHGHTEAAYEAFEATRLESGVFLGEVARPGSVIQTCFGWPAYEALQTTVLETCPLNTRKPVGAPTWGETANATMKAIQV